MKKLILLLALLACVVAFSQEQIDDKIYLEDWCIAQGLHWTPSYIWDPVWGGSCSVTKEAVVSENEELIIFISAIIISEVDGTLINNGTIIIGSRGGPTNNGPTHIDDFYGYIAVGAQYALPNNKAKLINNGTINGGFIYIRGGTIYNMGTIDRTHFEGYKWGDFYNFPCVGGRTSISYQYVIDLDHCVHVPIMSMN